jgi:alkanesulfonate monooxygenase SsuD/methylene tetrahydromethanopterin reductase-like flavin-dependent oxidoreductase (luciferase family)
MDFGVAYLPTHDGLSPGAVARMVEERGHESLFLSDHTHTPAGRASPSWPKPAQRPHPPVLIGGNGPTVLDRVLAFGDAWFPAPEPQLPERMRELRDRAERPIDVIVMGAGNDPAELASLRSDGVRRAVH